MPIQIISRKQLGLLAMCGGLSGLAGCRTCETNVCQPEMYRLPPGVVGGAYIETQATNALASRFVVYRHEWVGNLNDEGKILASRKPEDLTVITQSGLEHLQSIASNLETVNYPVIIEAGPDPALDEKRRLIVTEQLMPMLPEGTHINVVIAKPNEDGMRSQEAINKFRRVEGSGNPSGRFGFGYGGFQTGFGGVGGGIF